jgi:hypothetical protein
MFCLVHIDHLQTQPLFGGSPARQQTTKEKLSSRGSRILAGKKTKMKTFARVRTYNARLAAIAAHIEVHPGRLATLAVNCEFLPIAIPHYEFFGGPFHYLYGQSVGHKNPAKRFICGYCVVKIPDWKTCFSIYLEATLRQS